MDAVLSWLLQKYLGDYIEGISTSSINLSTNKAELKNLKLKKTALDGLELPICVKEGMVGNLFVNIPDLSDLNKKPVIFRLENIFLLASPKNNDTLTPEEMEEQFHKTKMKLLQMAELFSTSKEEPLKIKEGEKALGWLDSLKLNITANLQLFIDKIHIRYEDSTKTINKVPFAFGLTVESLQLQSVDENWKPNFVGKEIITRKLVSLCNIGIYYNTREVNSSPLIWKNSEELSQVMDAMIYKSDTKLVLNDYIIFPVSGEFKVTINKNKNILDPLLNISGIIASVKAKISAEQFHGIIHFFEWTRGYANRFKYITLQQFRPRPPINIEEKALSWWQYSFKCISKDIHDKNKIWYPENLVIRRNDRTQYRQLYDKQQLGKQLSTEEQKLMNDIEHNYSVPELYLFRQYQLPKVIERKDLTSSASRKELTSSSSVKLSSSQKESPQKQKGFLDTFSSFFAKKEESDKKDESTDNNQNVIENETSSTENSFVSLINWDDVIVENNRNYPAHYIQTKLSVQIKKCSLEILENQTYNRLVLAAADLLDYQAQFRKDWYTFKFDMSSIKAVDYFTCKEQKHKVQLLTTNKNALSLSSDKAKYFSLEYDINPILEDVPQKIEDRIRIVSQSATFTYSSALLKKLHKAFSLGADSGMKNVLLDIYSKGLEQFTLEAQNKLKYALEKNIPYDINIDLKAPTLILPRNPRDLHSTSVILDLGRLQLVSDLRPRLNRSDSLEEDSSLGTDMFYDQYNVNLTNVRGAIIHDSSQYKMEKINDLEFTAKFTLEVLMAKHPSLPKFKVRGDIDKVLLKASPQKISDLFLVMNSLVPKSLQSTTPVPSTTTTETILSIMEYIPNDKTNQTNAPIKLFNAAFKISEINTQLRLRDNDKSFIDLTLKTITASVDVTNEQFAINLQLHHISGHDEDMKYHDGIFLYSPEKQNQLIVISFRHIPPHSIFFKNLDNEMDIKFSKLDFLVYRPTILRLLKLFTSIDVNAIAPPSRSEQLGIIPMGSQDFNRKIAKVTASISEIRINFLKDDIIFLKTEIRDGDIELAVHKNETWKVSGKVTDLLLNFLDDNSKWKPLLQFSNKKVLDFYLETCENNKYSEILKITTGTAEFIYEHRAIIEIYQYMKSFGEMHRIIESLPKSKSRTFFDIVVNNPFLIVPQSSENEVDFFKCDLRKAHITNDISLTEDKTEVQNIFIRISECNIQAVTHDSEYKLLKKADASLNFSIPRQDKEHQYPEITATVELDEIILEVNDFVVDLLYKTLYGNIVEPVVRQDVKELELLKTLMAQTETKSIITNRDPYILYTLHLKIENISLEQVTIQSDGFQKGLANYKLLKFMFTFTEKSDTSNHTEFYLHAALLENTMISEGGTNTVVELLPENEDANSYSVILKVLDPLKEQ